MQSVLAAGLAIIMIVIIALVLGLPVMLLWNWLMPTIFGLPEIGFWQAVGLNLLANFLNFLTRGGSSSGGGSKDIARSSSRRRRRRRRGRRRRRRRRRRAGSRPCVRKLQGCEPCPCPPGCGRHGGGAQAS